MPQDEPDAKRDPNTITSKVEEPFESIDELEGAHPSIDELEADGAGLSDNRKAVDRRWADCNFTYDDPRSH